MTHTIKFLSAILLAFATNSASAVTLPETCLMHYMALQKERERWVFEEMPYSSITADFTEEGVYRFAGYAEDWTLSDEVPYPEHVSAILADLAQFPNVPPPWREHMQAASGFPDLQLAIQHPVLIEGKWFTYHKVLVKRVPGAITGVTFVETDEGPQYNAFLFAPDCDG